MNMENGAIKEEEERMKKSFITSLEFQFVDQFEKWKERSDMFNNIVTEYNKAHKKRLHQITYDQFCKLFIGGSRTLLDEHIRMHEIVPSKEEMEGLKTMDRADDANDFKQKYTSLLEAKYAMVKKTLAKLWSGHVFKYMVIARYGPQHYDDMLAIKNEVLNGD